ncbi:MAG TPA: MFS transporter [Candidatus Sulfotelmatobacter sp.]|nr:MFS transporter [Candidatus Sulfotelmatobacter sp.]
MRPWISFNNQKSTINNDSGTIAARTNRMAIGPIQLIRQATPGQRRTLLAAAMGWALDAFDAMLYSLVLAMLMRDLGMGKTTAGSLGTLTLLASGIGGVFFGFLADRIGRKHALMASILTYSLCSFASGLAESITMLAVARFVLGLGMGGEWNTGATLVAETWPTELRAKAISIVQSSWALGFAAAALVAGPVSRFYGWRAVFFVGILPALITLWIQGSVPESGMWQEQEGSHGQLEEKSPLLPKSGRSRAPGSFAIIFRPPYVKHTIALLLFNFFAMFAWWGLFTWLPPYLSLPVEQGGRGFGVMGMTMLMVVLNLCGMFPGYASFGWVADHIGRRNAFLVYSLIAACLIPLYAAARSQGVLLVVGTLVAFFGTGIFSGSGIVGSEIFPTAVRARALGFTYNGARTMSSLAPLVIGRVGQAKGLSWAFYLCAVGYLLAALITTQLPETRGKRLE